MPLIVIRSPGDPGVKSDFRLTCFYNKTRMRNIFYAHNRIHKMNNGTNPEQTLKLLSSAKVVHEWDEGGLNGNLNEGLTKGSNRYCIKLQTVTDIFLIQLFEMKSCVFAAQCAVRNGILPEISLPGGKTSSKNQHLFI